jgi:SAM-dependent methyltransferase
VVKRIGSDKRVLDIGGGVGVLAHKIKEAGSAPYVVDISPAAVQIAETVYGVPGEARAVPPLDGLPEADYLVATEFLEHLTDPDAFLVEAAQVANKAIYGVPNDCLGPQDEQEHNQQFTEDSLRDLLTKHYSQVEIESFTDQFLTGRVVKTDGGLTAQQIALPTLLAYCEV